MDNSHHGRPPTRRKAFADATSRANIEASSQRRSGEKHHANTMIASTIPHNESLVPNGTLAVRHGQPSPENKRVSVVVDEELPRDTKRDSEISNASTNASKTDRRRKTHIGPWQLGKTIGRGGCSRVRLVRHAVTGQYGAAKIISKKTAEQVRALSLANLIKSAEMEPSMFPDGKVIPFGLEREIVIMKLLDHPNIVRLHDVWENRNELYLIMEYVQGGELFHYIGEMMDTRGGLEEIEVVHLFRQVIAALLYCHRINIHHRDLKPENILLDRTTWTIKLVDFGMAALQPVGSKLSTPCGSPHYAAPEVIKSKSSGYDGGKADTWSCGVILFVMLTGSPPFNYHGDEHDLKDLFTAIGQANYVMPETISAEAQDLIRRILVPDPKKRIDIEHIWHHPFLLKYQDRLHFHGINATIESWVGPRPKIQDWERLDEQSIDREVLRHMRTLWHSVAEDLIVQRLLNKDSNQEKYFYSALLKYREEHLENYAPTAASVTYSTSDHHHVNYGERPKDLRQSSSRKHKRSQSTYSILNDEHLYSKHSFYEPPPSDSSYDPFRASIDPIVPPKGAGVNATIHRGSEAGSRKVRPASALGHRPGSSLRIHALRNSNRHSGLSHNASKRSVSSSRRSVSARRGSISRSSMASSNWPSSPPVSMRPSSNAKRGVSFKDLRRNSVTSAYTNDTAGPQYTPEQRKFLNPSRPSTGVPSVAFSQKTIVAECLPSKVAASPNVPRLRIKKPESPSKYIQKEARKVSTELEKVMEEAFNRSSISSSTRTAITDMNQVGGEYESPPTSFSNRGSGGSAMVTPNKTSRMNRPLPPLPTETPNTFVHRKLAETREELVRRLEKNEGGDSAHYNNVIESLDRLMHPASPHITSCAAAKRIASAPPKSPEYPNLLPAISEEAKDAEHRYDSHSPNYRVVTEPARLNLQARQTATHQRTVRLVDQSPTPIPIAPLNIRKRSGASTRSSSTHANAGPAVAWPGQSSHAASRSYLAARTNGFTWPKSTSPALSNDPNNRSVTKKKSAWFRRHVEDKEQQAGNLAQPDTQLNIPTAWQGLDDRVKNNAVASNAIPLTAPFAKHVVKQSDASSEFPMRNRDGDLVVKNEAIAPRKGFLGFFGKKAKEDKPKNNMQLASADMDNSSLLSGFDLASGEGASTRTPDVHMNWLSRFLHIKPASRMLCFRIGRGKVRADMVRLFRNWERFGVRDVSFDRKSNQINARVDKNNQLKIKPVNFVIELFVVLEHGRRANLCIARFTQTRGAASSFRKVVDIVEDICNARSMLVDDATKKAAMLDVLS